MCLHVNCAYSSKKQQIGREKMTDHPSFDDERRFAKLSYYWMSRGSWHVIKKLFNLPFLILKVKYPA